MQNNSPCAAGDREDSVVLCDGVFHTVLDDAQDALLDFEELVLQTMYMSAIPSYALTHLVSIDY